MTDNEMIAEAEEVLDNARAAYDNGEITHEQYEDVRRQTLEYLGVMYEVIFE